VKSGDIPEIVRINETVSLFRWLRNQYLGGYRDTMPTEEEVERIVEERYSVEVAGLGGLGGTLALLLARVGVGRLLLADGDVFVPSNLNRQFLATGRSLGLNKARAAADDLQDINPALLVVPILII
jgi:tRNA A37 threonylcarbamoyladenosine dehydratase